MRLNINKQPFTAEDKRELRVGARAGSPRAAVGQQLPIAAQISVPSCGKAPARCSAAAGKIEAQKEASRKSRTHPPVFYR